MSVRLDRTIQDTGTKFRIFPQPRFLEGFEEPETIVLSVPKDQIQDGPADDRFYVVDAINKQPYNYPYAPPHQGDSNPPVRPDPKTGHFDHLDVDSREFKAAQMYATVRRTLDIWEDYFGHKLIWHFSMNYARMELVPLIHWDNAHSGYGFLEFGFGRTSWGGLDEDRPYCMNFDVLAHELGHSIIFASVGFPNPTTETAEYGGHGEAAGDLVAIVTALHSRLVVDHLLDRSAGNLFSVNELSRVGELAESRQIRRAFNYVRMSTVTNEEHDLSKPLTGAIFDVFVEVFQKKLVQANLISQDLADRSYHSLNEAIDTDQIQVEFEEAYQGNSEPFREALFAARDYLGSLLAKTWDSLSPHYLTYADIGLQLIAHDAEMTGGEHEEVIRDSLAWREIQFPSDSPALQSHYVSHYSSMRESDMNVELKREASVSMQRIGKPKTKSRNRRREAAKK